MCHPAKQYAQPFSWVRFTAITPEGTTVTPGSRLAIHSFLMVSACMPIYSGMFAKQMGMQAETIKKEWIANLLPGVTVVPSGVIAVNRTQEKGCAYCFAG